HQLAGDMGALAHQHDDVRIPETHGELAQSLDRVGVDLGGVRIKPRRAVELADRILVIVEDHNVHPDIVPRQSRRDGGVRIHGAESAAWWPCAASGAYCMCAE